MGLSIATLQQKIHDRRVQAQLVRRVELGSGFNIEADRDVLYLTHDSEPDERAICGVLENTISEPRFILYREWGQQLRETFGQLPANLVIDGDQL